MVRKLGNLLAIVCCAVLWSQDPAEVCAQLPKSPIRGAYVTTDNPSEIFDIQSSVIQLEPLPKQESPPVVTALSASHDGKFLAVAGDDHAIRIIDVVHGAVVQTLVGHEDWIQSVCFASDSLTLYSAGDDGRILKWNYQYPVHAEEVLRVPYALRSLCVSTEKDLLAAGGFSTEVLVFDLSEKRILHRLQCQHGDHRCVQFSPDGTHLLAAGREGELTVWSTLTGQQLAQFHEHRARIYTAAFDADGKFITSAAGDRQVIQYDWSSNSVVRKTELAPAKLRSMCLINRSWLAAAGADNSVHLYDTQSNQVLAHLNGHLGTVAVMVPCGRYLASGSFDTTVRIWDLESIDESVIRRGKPAAYEPVKMDSRLRVR